MEPGPLCRRKINRYTDVIDAKPYTSITNMGCQAAIAVAKCSTYKQYNIGAVIKKGGRLLSLGFNKCKTSAFMVTKFRYEQIDKCHAEISTILRARGEIRGGKMYIARVKSSGNLGNSRPCRSCMSIIREAGIKQIVYTGVDGMWYVEKVF